MRMLLLAAAASLALAGCTTTAGVDHAIAGNLPKICAAADAAYTGFVAVSIVRPVSAGTAARVDRAREILEPLCADPTRANSGTVLVAALNAYLAIRAAREGA